MSSSEFSQKYGTLTNAEFVEQIYQNALGRNATMSELANWLGQLAAGTATRGDVVESVLESAEHIADGNVYQVTNNTYNTSGTLHARSYHRYGRCERDRSKPLRDRPRPSRNCFGVVDLLGGDP